MADLEQDPEDDSQREEPTEEQKEAIQDIMRWADEQGIDWRGFYDDGRVLDTDGEEHQSPYTVPNGDGDE